MLEATDELGYDDIFLSTHSIPFSVLIKILRNNGVKNIYVLGVVAKNIDLGFELSREVSETIMKLSRVLYNIVLKCLSRSE